MPRACSASLVMIALTAAAPCLGGCGAPRADDPRALRQTERIDRALAAGARFLLAQQSADGAWRSDTYGPFKDGASLTPLVVQALQASPLSPERQAAYRRGIDYLAAFARSDGAIESGPHGLSYPLYTAAGAVTLLSGENLRPSQRQARDAWLAYLRRRQLTEELGWQPADREYGGWGYCPLLPRKPPAGQLTPPLTESNLSATRAALLALQAAGIPADDPAVRKALVFVERCPNFGDVPDFDDGGFFFIYDDGVRNKAGVAGTDKQGRERYASYGSTTADGLRALLLCGLPAEHPRVRAARHWLETHFSATTHPGRYRPEREQNRAAVYYYYTCSIAEAFRSLAIEEVAASSGKIRWAEALADELLTRQHEDGSWSNPVVLVREDDPLVVTALAMRALAACRAGS